MLDKTPQTIYNIANKLIQQREKCFQYPYPLAANKIMVEYCQDMMPLHAQIHGRFVEGND